MRLDRPHELGLDFTPRLLPHSALSADWCGVFSGPEWAGPEGLSFRRDHHGTYIEYRGADGNLLGVLTLHRTGELCVLVEPSHRRRGIATAMLTEAARRGLPIELAEQTYTAAGWATVRKFLNERQAG